MADTAAATPQQLFKQWQNGDAAAGQAMAQRFTDWYYAITAVRLGDVHGRAPLERACRAFAEGVPSVPRSGELVDWAHRLVLDEVGAVGGRGAGGDFPNALTSNRAPSLLLQRARSALTETQVELLALAYEGSVPLRRLEQRAEELGGWPHAILDARYALKRALRRVEGVNFAVVPEKPDLDRAPLPLYEAARMSAPAEDAAFEQWLLSDMDLCRDVAEFAAFAHALRAGTYSAPAPQVEAPAPRRAPAPAPAPAPAAAAAGPPPVAPSPQSPPHRAVAGAVAVVLVLLAAILYTLFGAFQ
jgi:hypothetical protein